MVTEYICMQLIRCENATLDLVAVFRGMSSFSRLIVSVLGTEEIDVDILLMMKEEVSGTAIETFEYTVMLHTC